MRKKNLILLFFLFLGTLSAAPRVIGVQNPIPSETTALRELEECIRKIAGNGSGRLPEIRLSHDPALSCEEWKITREKGGAVRIAGGRPRGVLYGVYEFMERGLGVTFCAPDFTDYPKADAVGLPAEFRWEGKPAFQYRRIYYLTGNWPENWIRHAARLRMNDWGTEEYGFGNRPGRPTGCHSFYEYAKDFPREICWMNEKGERVKTTHYTQICYTHPEVRRRFKAKLREYIAEDRAECDKKQMPWPVVYDISHNDADARCHCPKCRKFIERYGMSALMLDFINDIAHDIAKDYPDIMVQTFAYGKTLAPPIGKIRAADNVIIRIAAMDFEFSHGKTARDLLRPLSDPRNAPYRKLLSDWSRAAKHLAIWDYWKLFYDRYPSPKGFIQNLPETIRYYHECGADYLMAEAEIDAGKELESFNDLRVWLGAKLMVNPYLDAETEMKRFFRAAYGEAAALMREYFDYLAAAMAREKRPLGLVPVGSRVYLSRDFFEHCNQLLARAQELTADDPERKRNVGQERLIVDLAEAVMFPPCGSEQKKRIEENCNHWGRRYYNKDYWRREGKKLTDFMLSRINRPPLPMEFARLAGINDLYWADFPSHSSTGQGWITQDSEAAGGAALSISVMPNYRKPTAEHNGKTIGMHEPRPTFGFYSRQGKPHMLLIAYVNPEQLPADEKYHWYKLGTAAVDLETSFFAHWSWGIHPALRDTLCDRGNPERKYVYYVSMKLQGPSYVKGSKLPDDLRVDRIVAIPADGPIPSVIDGRPAILPARK